MCKQDQSARYRRASLVLFSVAVILGAVSIYTASLDIGAYGLIHSLSPAYFVALFLLTVSFLVQVRFNEGGTGLIALHLVAMIVFLYFVAAPIEGTPRFPYAYHAYGHTEYIVRNGEVNTAILTYQYWPGQQYLGAMLVNVGGLGPLALLTGYPIALQLISLPLLYSILRTVTEDRKVVWVAIWVYFVAGWVNQAYYTSAAHGYFFFLMVILAALVWAIRQGERRLAQRVPLLVIVVLLSAALVIGHMLSSLAALFCLVVVYVLFKVKGVLRFRGPQSISAVMPGLLVAMIALWLFNPLGGFLSGTPVEVPGGGGTTVTENKGGVGGLFDFESNIRSAYESAISSSFELGEQHTRVMYIKVGLTAFFCSLPILGFLLIVARRRVSLNFLVVLGLLLGVGVIPFVLGGYSGEILSRVLGYGLLFLGLLAAYNAKHRVLSVLLIAFLVVCPVLFVASAYGNEKFDYVSPAEIKGVQFFYEHAPSDATVYSLTKRIWDFKYIERGYWRELDVDSIGGADSAPPGDDSRPEYVLLGERDIEGRTFLYGSVDKERLTSVATSSSYWKVYSGGGFDLFYYVREP